MFSTECTDIYILYIYMYKILILLHLACHICETLKARENLIRRRYKFYWKKSLLFSNIQKGNNCKWIDANSNKAGTISVTIVSMNECNRYSSGTEGRAHETNNTFLKKIIIQYPVFVCVFTLFLKTK